MKYTTALVATLAAAAAGVSAQDISIFPECSLDCIMNAIGDTPCDVTDFACVCENKESLTQGAAPCVISSCGIDTALSKFFFFFFPLLSCPLSLLPSLPPPANRPEPATANMGQKIKKKKKKERKRH